MGQTSQIQSFIDQINNTSNCATPRCQGKLVPVGMRVFGKGGPNEIRIACTGCTDRVLTFLSSVKHELSNHLRGSWPIDAETAEHDSSSEETGPLMQKTCMNMVPVNTSYHAKQHSNHYKSLSLSCNLI